MLQFISRRLIFIVLVCLLIVFFVNLGMHMIRNSEVAEPSYNLVTNGKIAWDDTRAYIRRVASGDLGPAQTAGGVVPVLDALKQSYVNSMGLLLTALGLALLVGLPLGSIAALSKKTENLPPNYGYHNHRNISSSVLRRPAPANRGALLCKIHREATG